MGRAEMNDSLRYGLRDPRFNAVRCLALGLVLAVLLPFQGVAADSIRLAVLGDSLTAGYGLAIDEAFPAQLERRLRAAGKEITVINAGVSGDTSAGGLARVDWTLGDNPNFVLIELGANDGLRGIEPDDMEANLAAIIERLQAQSVSVMLAGMLAPPNLGRDYADAFNAVYPRLAARYDVAFYPFFLDGVAADPSLNQDDGIHPTADGVAAIVERILPHVESWLGDAS